jgi:hypothetical protein
MTDLSDFDAGVDHDEQNPEDEINRMLSNWLRHEDRGVYWDREKTYGNGTFSVSTRRRPDLVVTSQQRNYAIEVKRAEDSANVHDGAEQVFQYWRDLVDGEASYSVGGKTVGIDAVLLATDYSPEGHLFHNWKKKDVMRSGRSDGAARAAEFGQIPQIEHATSETLIRMLHRFARGYDDTATVGIGGLLSSALDGDSPNTEAAHPGALYYALGSERVQNWEYIPWYLND